MTLVLATVDYGTRSQQIRAEKRIARMNNDSSLNESG